MTTTFLDPHRKEILLANGPQSLVGVGDQVIISFTQINPRVGGSMPGLQQMEFDAIVVCRVAIQRQTARELIGLLDTVLRAGDPAAGTA